MNAELKLKWMNGLLCGMYAQGKGFLRRRNRFCALGVLCDVSGVVTFKPSQNELWPGVYQCETSDGEGASKWLTPNALTEEQYQHIANMNDRGRRFKTIAKWIEKNIPAE